MRIDPAPDGWFIENNNRYYHVNERWLDDIERHQIRPNKSHNPAFNKLRWLILSGSDDAQLVAETFAEAYGQITGNRAARKALGLKAVTRDGDEDLHAVQEGAPVRPWNAADPKTELHEWIRGQRDKSNT